MKTAVSIPDDVFHKADRLARRSGKSRSELYSAALREYVASHGSDEITEAMDRICQELQGERDEFVETAARQVLETTDW